MEFLLLADSDILIHFHRANKLALLPKILPQKICLLDAVVSELSIGGQNSLYNKIKKVLGGQIIESEFTDKPLVYNEWVTLVTSNVGAGESACLALARYEGHYIASSNLRDINDYCKAHKIRIYTTMDLVHEAYKKKLMDKDDCEAFISDVIMAGSRGLPCRTFEEYLNTYATNNPWNKYDST